MALRSDDFPELPNPAKATLGLAANRFCTCATTSSMPSRGTGLRTMSPQFAPIEPSGPALRGLSAIAPGCRGRSLGLRASVGLSERNEGRNHRADQAADAIGEGVEDLGVTTWDEELVNLVGNPVDDGEESRQPDEPHF